MKKLLVLLLISFLAIPQAQAVQSRPIPSPSKDFENGLQVALEAIKELGLVDDPAQTKRVNDIGYRVAQRAVPDMPYFSFRIVRMEEPNAFALPGGFIFVTSGMMNLDLTDDELAALLGHEITHVKNNHMSRMSKRQTLMNLLYQALIIGIALGIKENGPAYNPATGMPTRSAKSEILQGSAAFGLIFQELLLRGFSRELELEADHEGMIAAAGAGFSPQGTVQLFEKMRRKIYEAPGYGYWRTHPYLEDRVSVARSLATTIEPSKNPPDPQDFRLKTQQTFLHLIPFHKEKEQEKELRRMALNACRTGKGAQDLRWSFIHDAEKEENQKEPFFRDYGKIIHLYQENIQELKQEADASDFVQKLEKNLQETQKERDAAKPLYEEVLGKQVFDTEMLERYLSNFPDSPIAAEVHFRLAENYRLLKKHRQAIDLYLEILQTPEWKDKSKQSLLQLLPNLEDLSSCYKVAVQSKDPELQKLSQDRMKVLADSFSSLQNGYEFRRNYPSSDYEKPVLEQMTKLASATLNQGKLYQAIGEYQKALDQYNQILRYCPDLPVADQVKETIVDFQELQSNKG